MGNGWEMENIFFFIKVDLWLILFFNVENSWKIEMCWNPGFPITAVGRQVFRSHLVQTSEHLDADSEPNPVDNVQPV